MKNALRFLKANFLPISVFVFIFVGLFVRDIHLFNVLFYDWDESMYAQIAREMIKSKSLITTFNGEIWFDKPPLAHLVIAIIFMLFGESEFYSRLLFVFLSITLLVFVYLLTKKVIEEIFQKEIKNNKKFINQITYLLPVFVISSANIFIDRATLLNTDTIIAVTWVGYLLFIDNYKIKGIMLVIGVWSKSVFGYYPLIIDIFRLRRRNITFKNVVKYVGLFAISSLWYLYGFLYSGSYFLDAHFLGQVLKRVGTPIELHDGGKYYYFIYLWKDIGILNILIFLGFVLIGLDVLKNLKAKKLFFLKSSKFINYLILLSSIPFLVLLTFSKTKIYWYIEIILPLLSLPIAYLFISAKNRVIKFIIASVVIVFFLISFVSQTYLLQIKYTLNERQSMALCSNKLSGSVIGVLVDEEERKVQNVLLAAHYDTPSSFYYGGSPSYVYYVQKRVKFFYNVEEFEKNLSNFSLLSLSTKDLEKNATLKNKMESEYTTMCTTENLVTYQKKSK